MPPEVGAMSREARNIGAKWCGYYYFPPGTIDCVAYAILLMNQKLAIDLQLAGEEKNKGNN